MYVWLLKESLANLEKSKKNLELQVGDLCSKISQLEANQSKIGRREIEIFEDKVAFINIYFDMTTQ